MKHSFCKVTGYCEKCGFPRDEYRALPPHIRRIASCNPGRNVVSLDWARKLKAHNQLKETLMESVGKALS